MVALTANQLGYLQMMLSSGVIDGANANVRTNFGTLFSGKTTLTNLTNIAQRTGTRLETLFTTASVCAKYGYKIGAFEVQQILGK